MKLIHVLFSAIVFALAFGGCTTTQQQEGDMDAAMEQAADEEAPKKKVKKGKKGKKEGKKGKKGKKGGKKKKKAAEEEG